MVYAALIAASAAIVGGIIGGAIPGVFMLKAEDKRQAHARQMANQAREDERERELRAVIGTARAVYEFFERLDGMFANALRVGRWWTDELDAIRQHPSFDDQKAVLGQLAPSEAALVAVTMRAMDTLRTERGAYLAVNQGDRTLDEDAISHLEQGRTAAQGAVGALRRVAELPAPPTTTES